MNTVDTSAVGIDETVSRLRSCDEYALFDEAADLIDAIEADRDILAAERDAALSELAKLKAENARLYDAIGDERESCVDVVKTYRKRAKHSGYWAGYHEDVIAAIRARSLPSPPKDPAHD